MPKINTGAVYVTAPAPTRKGGAWVINQKAKVGGTDAADAVAFADALFASLRTHRDMEEARWRTWGPPILDSIPHCAGHEGGRCYAGSVHTGQCQRLHRMRYPDRDGTAELVERFRAMRGTPAVVPAPVRARAAKVARKPARKVQPSTSYVSGRNGSTGPASRGRFAERSGNVVTGLPAVSVAQDAPPADPTACPRCGRTGWKSDVGRAWHIDNNPDCRRFRRPDRHQYAQA